MRSAAEEARSASGHPPDAGQPRSTPAELVTLVVFVAFLGQMTLNPIVAPLARAIGLEPWQIGVTISAAAMMLVLTSQRWGRAAQARGHKAILSLALALASVTMALFALAAGAGMAGLMPSAVLFVVVLLTRGIGYGVAVAAVLPTAQAVVADVASTEAERVRGMARIGAAQAGASIVGAIIGGGLAAFGLAAPLIVVPILLVAAWLLVRFGLREQPAVRLISQPRTVRATDPRVWPYLAAGFGLFTGFGFVQVVIGFLIQDRFGFTAVQTGVATGVALLMAGAGMMASQVLLVPRLGWSAAKLLGGGAGIALTGFLLMLPAWGLTTVIVAVGLVGAGIGLSVPGYTAGPMGALARDEQGSLAGLIGATNGLTFVVAPTLSTVLYQLWGPLPLVVAAALMLAVIGLVRFVPHFEAGSTKRSGMKVLVSDES